ncbi:MAG: tetratricopeptide repeat protein [Clostridia bacterium]|nr:tetratricopeptide repeat protein [Clostridia bacterium]
MKNLYNITAFFAIIIAIFACKAYASEKDSLYQLIQSGRSDSLTMMARLHLADYLSEQNLDSAFVLVQAAEEYLQNNQNFNLKITLLLSKSNVLQIIGKYPEALELMFEAKKLLENIPELEADSLQRVNYLRVIGIIGVIFFNTEKYEEAIAYFEKGLNFLGKLSSHTGNRDKLDYEFLRFNLNYGSVLLKLREYDKAEIYYTKALQYLAADDRNPYAILLNNLSIIAREKGDLHKAFELNHQAIDVWKNSNNSRGLAQGYNNLGHCFMMDRNYEQALQSYQTALDLSNQYNVLPSAVIALEQLSALYDSIGNYKQAYLASVRFKQVSDSLLDLEKIQLVTRLEMQEKFDKRLTQNRLLQQEKESEQRRRELIYTITILFTAMALSILILLFYLQRSKSKTHRLQAEKTTLLNKSLALEKTNLQEELEFRNKELATNVMYMIRKNELITRIFEKLIQSKLLFKKENQKIIEEIIHDLQSSTDDDVWTEFEVRFQQVHNDFYTKLNERFPNLSANEKKLCAFLRLNMSTKEISAITYQSPNSIVVARSRLRKKLGIDTDESLVSFLETL